MVFGGSSVLLQSLRCSWQTRRSSAVRWPGEGGAGAHGTVPKSTVPSALVPMGYGHGGAPVLSPHRVPPNLHWPSECVSHVHVHPPRVSCTDLSGRHSVVKGPALAQLRICSDSVPPHGLACPVSPPLGRPLGFLPAVVRDRGISSLATPGHSRLPLPRPRSSFRGSVLSMGGTLPSRPPGCAAPGVSS